MRALVQDVLDAGVTLDELESSGDPRAARVAAAATLRRKHLAPNERKDIAAIERRRKELKDDPRDVELRYFPAPWQGRGDEAMPASNDFKTSQSTVARLAAGASVNRRPALLLYALVREFMPKRAVEMGSSVGISGSYQATALRHARSGSLLVLEGAPDLAAVARETYASLGLDVEVRVGPFTETLEDGVAPAVDYVYVDGHHDGRATIEYFETILPHAPNALLVFDDIRWSDDMSEAWRTIAHDGRVSFAVNAKRFGLAFTGAPAREPRLRLRPRPKKPSELLAG